MQTHMDNSHGSEFMKLLRERANEAVKNKASEITAGKEGEQPLAVWKSNGVGCRHMPDDEQGILRISIGGCETAVGLNYCVIRGDLGQCIGLLEKALVALRDAP